MGSSQKWELQCLYVYIIPLVTCFPNMAELLTEMRIAMYVYVYVIPLITYFPNMDG